jgi:hypothetical protein
MLDFILVLYIYLDRIYRIIGIFLGLANHYPVHPVDPVRYWIKLAA